MTAAKNNILLVGEDGKDVLPVVIFPSSRKSRDIKCTYDVGANSFLVKPAERSEIVKQLNSIVSVKRKARR